MKTPVREKALITVTLRKEKPHTGGWNDRRVEGGGVNMDNAALVIKSPILYLIRTQIFIFHFGLSWSNNA